MPLLFHNDKGHFIATALVVNQNRFMSLTDISHPASKPLSLEMSELAVPATDVSYLDSV